MLILIIFAGFGMSASAQVRTIKGTVTAADTRETLPGATVLVKGSTLGTVSDISGNYTLKITQPNTVLTISYLGYNTQDVVVGDKTVIDVVLEPKKTTLDELVVIGYGTVRKSDLSGSVGSVKSEDITKITALNPVQSLQGKVAGVQVTSTSGTPGESPVVRIRGVGTFNESSPIYVVDGIILNSISFLNSADITSMEVLKDASATAIYGSRGANGVIMVTTKQGKIGQEKTAFSFTGEIGMQNLAKKIDLLNGHDFAMIANEISPGTYNNIDVVPNTDWQKEVFHAAPIYNFQLSASGATKNMQFYISGGYFKQEGIIEKSKYERITLQLNNTYILSSHVKLGNTITLSPYNQRVAPDVTWAVYRAKPTLEPYHSDGSFGAIPGVGNPLADLAYSNNYNKGLKGVGNLYAEISFLKSFALKSSFGLDAEYNKSENFTPAFTVYNDDGTISQQQHPLSTLSKGISDNLTWLWENTLTYQKEIKKHSINAVLGYTMQNTSSTAMGLLGSNILRDNPNFWYINPNNIYDPSNNVNNINSIYDNVDINMNYSMISYLFRVNYVFNKRYILTATFRSDGSSKFSDNNKFASFPSFAAAWNVNQENFMKNLKFISKLKLRGSWGKLGNDKIPYDRRYAKVESNIITIIGTNGSPNSGASYGVNGNPALKWEVTTQTDIGLEASMFGDRLTCEVDYYNKKTDDILIDLSTPGYFGNGPYSKVTYNAASVLNRGFEFNLGWRDQVGKVKYNISVNGTTIHNEALKIGGSYGVDSVLIGGYLANGIPVTRSKVGLPIGAFYGYKTDGIFQTQAELDATPHDAQAGVGDLKFVDVNGDGKIDGRDRTYIGSPIPSFIFGCNFGLEYKGIDFSFNIQGQTGNKIFNAKNAVRPDPYNFESNVLNRWTGPGTSNTEPRASFGGYNYTPSDYFIQDGSFIRLRNIILGYTLPAKACKKIAMQTIRVYIKADNLYTLTKYSGYTPEIASGNVIGSGIDGGVYPITAVFSFGVNLNF
ncbi:MAG: TonB-dependent receptor [Bacteroidota bacterium]